MDGTDCERSKTNRSWFLHKHDSGERYEVAVSILGGDVCWICGPWKPGVYNDLDIFCEGLLTQMAPGESVEAGN